VASIDRTAYPRFTRLVSTKELSEAFTPTTDEIAWARGRTQNDQHLLVLTVWFKCYQRLGYFPKLVDVPDVVADHVRHVLEQDFYALKSGKRNVLGHRVTVHEDYRLNMVKAMNLLTTML
jgi:hypothetical protein